MRSRFPAGGTSGISTLPIQMLFARESLGLILTQRSGTLEKFFEEFLSLLEYTGVSPIVFTRIARFESALRLKGSSSLESWTAIAHMLGYHDQMHMTRAF